MSLSRLPLPKLRSALIFLSGLGAGALLMLAILGWKQPPPQPALFSQDSILNPVAPTPAAVAAPSTSTTPQPTPSPSPTSAERKLQFSQAVSLTDRGQRHGELREVLKTWIIDDQTAALQAIDNLDNPALRRDLLQFSLTTLADQSPAAAIALLESRPSVHHDHLWERAFLTWAQTDLQAAVNAWEQQQHPDERREALKGLANAFAKNDLAAALEWATTLPSPEESRRAMRQIVGGSIHRDPALAAQHIDPLTEIDREAALSYVDQIANRWGDQDRQAAIEWAETLIPEQRDRALREIAHRQLHQDPKGAQALALRIDDRDLRLGVISELGKLWMSAGPSEAAGWIQQLSSEEQQAAWRGAAPEWARTHPEQAAEFALSGDLEPAVQRRLLDTALPQWSRIAPQQAADWALELPENLRHEALEHVIQEWSAQDPHATIDFLAHAVDDDQWQSMTQQAVTRWSHNDPAQASRFVSDLEPGAVKDHAAREVASTWMRRNSVEASKWIASLDPSPARDQAVEVLIQHIQKAEPDAAILWAETITDTGRRNDLLTRLNSL